MDKFKVLETITVSGFSMPPFGGKAQVLTLTKTLKKGDVIEANIPLEGKTFSFIADSGIKEDGTVYSGMCAFKVPINKVATEVTYTGANPKDSKSMFTTKNVLIGVAVLGTVFVGLKLAKII